MSPQQKSSEEKIGIMYLTRDVVKRCGSVMHNTRKIPLGTKMEV
jgi:hypothetical protein